VAVRVELEKAPEGLHGNDRPGLGVCLGQDFLKVLFEALPGAAAQRAKELPVIEKGPAKYFRDTEDPVTVGDGFDDLFEEPLAELDHALLVAGGAEVPALAREGQEIFMAASIATDPGEAVLEDAAVEEPVDDVSDIGAEKSVLAGKAFIHEIETTSFGEIARAWTLRQRSRAGQSWASRLNHTTWIRVYTWLP
jgi:hypothetical protein